MKILLKNKNTEINLLYAMIIMQGLLTGFFEHALGMQKNANLMVLLLWVLVFVCGLLKGESYRIHISSMIWCVYIILAFFVSKYVINVSTFYPVMILFYAIIPILIAGQKVTGEKILRYCMYISLLSVFYLGDLFAFQYEGYNQASMGNSYSVAVGLVAFILHFYYFRKNTSITVKIIYIYELFLMVRLISTGNRGAILSILVCAMLILLNKKKSSSSIKKKITLIVLCIIVIFVYLNIESVLGGIMSIMDAMNIQVPSFILKSVELVQVSGKGIVNGRNELYTMIFDYLWKNPIIGYGIGSFPTYTNYPWAHNFLLQFWFEGGAILFFVSILIVLGLAIFLIKVKEKKLEELVVCMLIFCECIPRYLISNDPWRGTAVWMMMSFGTIKLLKNIKIRNKSYKLVMGLNKK